MARRAPHEHDLLFLDFETGGLSPITNDFVEVGCVRTDPTGRVVQAEYTAKVFPRKPVDAEAAAINGYNTEKWASEAVDANVALIKVLSMARDTMMVCHNTPFDRSFLEAGMAAYKMRWPGSYHSLDTVSLAMPLLRAGLIPNVRLTTLTTYFKIPHTAHRAIGDVHACRDVYLRLMEIYGPGVQKHAETWESGLE